MSNGNGESRLDRIERALDRLVGTQADQDERLNRHGAALDRQREEFDREHKALLTAQVVLTDRVDKLAIAQAETTDKLNALIDLMDRHLREGHH